MPTIGEILSLCFQYGFPLVKDWRGGKLDEKRIKAQQEALAKKEEIIKHEKPRNFKKKINSHELIPEFEPKKFELKGSIEETGREMWDWGHKETLNIPENADKQELVNVMGKIDNAYRHHPCKECQNHYRQHVRKGYLTDHLDTKKDAVRKLFVLHNLVNQGLGKREFTVKEFEARYGYKI